MFDPNKFSDPEKFSLIPQGDYLARIEKADHKVGQNSGPYLSFTFVIIEGQHKGRKVWQSYFINASNEGSRESAQRSFAQLCRSVGAISGFDESNEALTNDLFLGQVVIISVFTGNGKDRDGAPKKENRISATGAARRQADPEGIYDQHPMPDGEDGVPF